MTPSSYTIIRDMDPDRPSGQFTTEDPEEADEFLEMAHARRPWARITIYNEEGQIRVKPRSGVDEAGETN